MHTAPIPCSPVVDRVYGRGTATVVLCPCCRAIVPVTDTKNGRQTVVPTHAPRGNG